MSHCSNRAGETQPASTFEPTSCKARGVTSTGEAWASGGGGAVWRDDGSGWERLETEIELDIESLHAVWVDPDGEVWTVGGNVISARDSTKGRSC